jgi:hypothetical protein
MVMNNTDKMRGAVCPVNTPVVRDPDDRPPSAARIPSADLHARRLAREAERWIAFARERARMRDDALVRKALEATAFSARHGTLSLAVPSKLAGTGQHQRALWALVREGRSRWCPLDLHDEGGRLLVSMPGGEALGEVQGKHYAWLRPLVRFGARAYLARVTGHERAGYTLGLNVAFGHVGAALDKLLVALGEAGPSGDGAAANVQPRLTAGGASAGSREA